MIPPPTISIVYGPNLDWSSCGGFAFFSLAMRLFYRKKERKKEERKEERKKERKKEQINPILISDIGIAGANIV